MHQVVESVFRKRDSSPQATIEDVYDFLIRQGGAEEEAFSRALDRLARRNTIPAKLSVGNPPGQEYSPQRMLRDSGHIRAGSVIGRRRKDHDNSQTEATTKGRAGGKFPRPTVLEYEAC